QPIPSLRVINVDKNRAYPPAVEELKIEGTLRRRCRVRQCKYLNDVVEQDHRVSKKRVWLARGYQSFSTAWRTLQGIEAAHMIRKARARWVSKGDPLAQLQFIDGLFGLSRPRHFPKADGRPYAVFARIPHNEKLNSAPPDPWQ